MTKEYHGTKLRYEDHICGDELADTVLWDASISQMRKHTEKEVRQLLRDLAPQGCVEVEGVVGWVVQYDPKWVDFWKLPYCRIKLVNGEVPEVL